MYCRYIISESPCKYRFTITPDDDDGECVLRRVMNSEDTDVIFVPLSLSFSFINPRHSYPPLRCLSSMPVQHIMRSYSDSHLFLKLAAATGAVGGGVNDDEDRTSWYSGGELWDMDYVQHWLRLDETRTAIQQRMEYDAAELEDWTMDDGSAPGWKRMSSSADGKQQSLPCIEEDDATSSATGGVCKGEDGLMGSTKDMSWHHFHHDHHNHLHHNLHQQEQNNHDQPHPSQMPQQLPLYGSGSPGHDSWSSTDEYAAADSPPSKRSSMSCSDSIELLPPPGPIAGTDFTRDFYRLVKFESSKSLASTSSRSVTGGGCDQYYRKPSPVVEAQLDREQALQSVLDFIAEQQQYCLSRQAEDKREPSPSPSTPPPQSPTPALASPTTIAVSAREPTPESASPAIVSAGPADESSSSSSPTTSSNKPPPVLQTCDSNSCSDNLLNSKDSGLCGSDVEIECLPEDCYADRVNSPCTATQQLAASTSAPRSTALLLRTVPEEDEECSAKSTSPQPSSADLSSVCTAETAVMVTWAASSSKDLIDQLNRMEVGNLTGTSASNSVTAGDLFCGHDINDHPEDDVCAPTAAALQPVLQTDLDEACCCPTGWIHVERDIDFDDPMVRSIYIIAINKLNKYYTIYMNRLFMKRAMSYIFLNGSLINN